MQSILLIDDHDDFRTIMGEILRGAEYDVWEATCPDQAFQMLAHEQPDLIICDLHMPFVDDERMRQYQYSYEVGVKTIEEFQWAIPHVPILIASAAVPNDIQKITSHLKSVTTMTKPIQPRKLLATVDLLMRTSGETLVH